MIDKLIYIGFSPAEAKVFELLLQKEFLNSATIIKTTKISASNVYLALDKLIARGVISKIILNERAKYKANKSALSSILKKALEDDHATKIETIARLQKTFDSVLTKASTAKENAEIYVGIQNIRSAYARLFSEKNNNDEFVFFYKYEQQTGDVIHSFFTKMDINDYYKSIKTRALFSQNYEKLFRRRKNAKFSAKFTSLPIPSSINIYQDKVLIIHWSSMPTAFILQSNEIADNFRELFNDVWDKTQ